MLKNEELIKQGFAPRPNIVVGDGEIQCWVHPEFPKVGLVRQARLTETVSYLIDDQESDYMHLVQVGAPIEEAIIAANLPANSSRIILLLLVLRDKADYEPPQPKLKPLAPPTPAPADDEDDF